ncbi:hypothetical protein [Burkholderia pseudomallei]|uniref:hypothetical protein n=1 Tax=Burkholderia pseudomallei TaxID=28450 RepID=UPI0011C4E0B2|nr:hypothetical protein [Burkholderia pseudomallei]
MPKPFSETTPVIVLSALLAETLAGKCYIETYTGNDFTAAPKIYNKLAPTVWQEDVERPKSVASTAMFLKNFLVIAVHRAALQRDIRKA